MCGRKRKGTPVKVCDRAYVTEDEEEESMSEHSYSPGTNTHTHLTTCCLCIHPLVLVVISNILQYREPPFILQTYGSCFL